MKIGLKLWSPNTDNYLNEAVRLFDEGVFDYIELYTVPDTLETIKKWQKVNIPFALHAPHFVHGANLADKDKFDFNKAIYDQVKIFADELDAEYVVVHSGMAGDINETIRQLNIIKLKSFLIENKPYHAVNNEALKCRGSTFAEIEKVINETGCKLCLDIGHAMCAANALEIEPYSYIEKFNTLNPHGYHISDNQSDSSTDRHLHFGTGNIDFKRIFSIINHDRNVAVETNKSNKDSLDDFKDDCLFIKKFVG